MSDATVARSFRVAGRLVRASGPSSFVDRALGPLRTLATDDAPAAALSIELIFAALAPDAVPPVDGPRITRWADDHEAGDAPRVVADDLGFAELPRSGPMRMRVREDLPPGDEAAERLTIPALAERMRREGIRLVHAACLLPPDRSGVWLAPAARGGGKTTLSLSLRRAGWHLLSDDRGWLLEGAGPDAPVLVDPWPEPPRVGDRSLYLLPPHAAAGPRDPRTGKAPIPSLLPPRLPDAMPVVGVFFPRLGDGPGGATRDVRGAEALASFATQAVVSTDPATAADTLQFVAALLARVGCVEVCIGDDAVALARGVERAIGAHDGALPPLKPSTPFTPFTL